MSATKTSTPKPSTSKPAPSHKHGASTSKVKFGDRWAAYLAHHKLTAADSLRRLFVTPIASGMTWLVLAIALALPMTLYVAMDNIKQLSGSWQQTSQISVFLRTGIKDSQGQAVMAQIQSWPQISDTRYISADDALKQFSNSAGLSDVLASLSSNPLPAVISVVPNLTGADADMLAQLQQRLSELPNVESVQLDMQWVQRLYQFMELGQRVVWALGALLALAVLLIIGNTIRLAIENRRDEIRVVKLVGGTDAFVRRPFLYTGIWYGLGGGLLAWVLLAVGLFWLTAPVEQLISLYGSDFQLKGLGFGNSLTLLSSAVLLGWLGAWVAVGRHIKSIEP